MLNCKLKVILAERNMTQKELSEIINVRAPTISAIANNTAKQIPVYVICRMCELFACQPGDIWEYIPELSHSPLENPEGK